MDRSVDTAVVEHVALEIEELTPREARKLRTEAGYNENNGSIMTESEGTISHYICFKLWYEIPMIPTLSIVDDNRIWR